MCTGSGASLPPPVASVAFRGWWASRFSAAQEAGMGSLDWVPETSNLCPNRLFPFPSELVFLISGDDCHPLPIPKARTNGIIFICSSFRPSNPSTTIYSHSSTSQVCVPFPRPKDNRIRPPNLACGLLHSPSCAQIYSWWIDCSPIQPPSMPPTA